MSSVPRAAIYTRVSTEKQESNYSLATQEEACRQYCAERGYEVVATFTDVYSGGVYRERPQLTRLRELVRAGGVDVVVAYCVDRLSRNQAHLYILFEEFTDHGCRVEFVTERFEDNAMGRAVLALKALAAEAEREQHIERVVRGIRARIRSGKPKVGARPPYGYRYSADKSRFEPEPNEALVVKRIFTLLANGASLHGVAVELERLGIPSPSGRARWSSQMIRNIARNPTYIGQYYALRTQTVRENGKVQVVEKDASEWVLLPDVAPPLIDEETWRIVQVRLDRNKEDARRNLKSVPDALLRGGFVRCGTCGSAMVIHTNKKGYARYRCSREVDGRCPAPATTAVRRLDELVRERLVEILAQPQVLLQAAEDMDREPMQLELAAEAERIQRMIAELQRRRRNYLEAVGETDDPFVRRDLLERAESLAEQMAELEREAQRIASARQNLHRRREALLAFADNAAALAQRFRSLPLALQRDALRALGVTVRVYPPGVKGKRAPVEIELQVPVNGEVCVNDWRQCSGGHFFVWSSRGASCSAGTVRPGGNTISGSI